MKRQSGLTVVELMIAVTIAGILLGVGIPSYRYIANSYRMSAEVNGLLGDLQFARAEAIKEGQTVTTCVSTDGATCTGGTAWAGGWIVFSDPNGNAKVDAGENVLRTQRAFIGAVPDTFTASNAITAITYNREGFATTAAGFPNTTITLHDKTASKGWTRCLWVTPVGMLTTETPANNPSGTCS